MTLADRPTFIDKLPKEDIEDLEGLSKFLGFPEDGTVDFAEHDEPPCFASRLPESFKLRTGGPTPKAMRAFIGYLAHFLNVQAKPIYYYLRAPQRPQKRLWRMRMEVLHALREQFWSLLDPRERCKDHRELARSLGKPEHLNLAELVVLTRGKQTLETLREAAHAQLLSRWKRANKRWLRNTERAAESTNLETTLGFGYRTLVYCKRRIVHEISFLEYTSLRVNNINHLQLATREKPFVSIYIRSAYTNYITVNPARLREWAEDHGLVDLFERYFPNLMIDGFGDLGVMPSRFNSLKFAVEHPGTRSQLEELVKRLPHTADLLVPILNRASDTPFSPSSFQDKNRMHTPAPLLEGNELNDRNWNDFSTEGETMDAIVSPSSEKEKKKSPEVVALRSPTSGGSVFLASQKETNVLKLEAPNRPRKQPAPCRRQDPVATDEELAEGQPEVVRRILLKGKEQKTPVTYDDAPEDVQVLSIPPGWTFERQAADRLPRIPRGCVRNRQLHNYNGKHALRNIRTRTGVRYEDPCFPVCGTLEEIQHANEQLPGWLVPRITEFKDIAASIGASRAEVRALITSIAKPGLVDAYGSDGWIARVVTICRLMAEKDGRMMEELQAHLTNPDNFKDYQWLLLAYDLGGAFRPKEVKRDLRRAVFLSEHGFGNSQESSYFNDSWKLCRTDCSSVPYAKAGSMISSWAIRGLVDIQTSWSVVDPGGMCNVAIGDALKESHADLWELPMKEVAFDRIPDVTGYADDARLNKLMTDVTGIRESFDKFRVLVRGSFTMHDVERVCPFAARIVQIICTFGVDDRDYSCPVPLEHCPPRMALELARMVGRTVPLASLIEGYLYPSVWWDRYKILEEQAATEPETRARFFDLRKNKPGKLFEWLLTDLFRGDSFRKRDNYTFQLTIQDRIQSITRQTVADKVLLKFVEDPRFDRRVRYIVRRLDSSLPDCWAKSMGFDELDALVAQPDVQEGIRQAVAVLPWLYLVFERLLGSRKLDEFMPRHQWIGCLRAYHTLFERRTQALIHLATPAVKFAGQ